MNALKKIQRFFAENKVVTAATRMSARAKPQQGNEIVRTPSSLNSSLDRFVQELDPGLITTTGKTLLEEEKGLEIFAEMMRDPQVRASIGVKKYAIISNRWSLYVSKGEEENRRAQEIKEFVDWNLNRLLGDTGIGLDCLLTAFEYGRADCEIIWDKVKSGRWAGKYYIKALKPKNIGYIAYELDEYNNIVRYQVTDGDGKVTAVPKHKMVHYAWNPQFENPYGNSDLASCYIWYWLKKNFYKFSAVYGEKYASPIPVFEVDKNITPADRVKLEEAAKNFQITGSFILPKGVKLDLKEINGAGGDYYFKGISHCDSQMSRAICLQTLTTNENLKTGTQAQARIHENTLWYLLKKIQDDLEDVVEEQVIQQIVDVNFPTDGLLAPRFGFEVVDPERFGKIAASIKELCTPPTGKANSIVDLREDWIRDRLGIPGRDLRKYPFLEENQGEGDDAAGRDE